MRAMKTLFRLCRGPASSALRDAAAVGLRNDGGILRVPELHPLVDGFQEHLEPLEHVEDEDRAVHRAAGEADGCGRAIEPEALERRIAPGIKAN